MNFENTEVLKGKEVYFTARDDGQKETAMRNRNIRHGPVWLMMVVVLLLASCGGGASHLQVQPEQEAVSGPIGLPQIGGPETWSRDQMLAKISDPAGIMSARYASAAPPRYNIGKEQLEAITAEFIRQVEEQGVDPTAVRIPANMIPQENPDYSSWLASRKAVRGTSGISDITVQPIQVAPFTGERVVYIFKVPCDTYRIKDLQVEARGTGSYYVAAANYTQNRYDISTEQHAASAMQPWVLNSETNVNRYCSDAASQSGPIATLAVIADKDAVVDDIVISMSDRDDKTVHVPTASGIMSNTGSLAIIPPKGASSMSSSVDGGEVDYSHNWSPFYDGNDTPITQFSEDNGDIVGGIEYLAGIYVNNDDNSFIMQAPDPGTHLVKTFGFTLAGAAVDQTVGTIDIDCQAPTGLSVDFDGASTATLTWETPAQGVTGYQIQRSVDGAGFSSLATVGDVTTYQDLLDGDYSYVEYKLKAYYTDGSNVNWYSQLTDPAGVNTLPVTWTNVSTITAAVATAFGQTATGPVAAANVSGQLVLYRISNGAWVSANIAATDAQPTSIWVDGMKVGIVAHSQPADDSAGLDVYVLSDYTNPSTVTDSVVEYHNSGANTAPGSRGNAVAFLSPHPTVVYETGSDQKTLRFAQANLPVPDSDDWNVNYVLATATDSITQIAVSDISGKPIVLYHVGPSQSWIAASQVDSPTSASDWDIYQLTGLLGQTCLAVVQTIPVVVETGSGAIRIIKGDTTPADATHWTTLNFLQGAGVYNKAQASVVEDASGVERLMITYNKRDTAQSTTSTLYSGWCSTAICSPDDNPDAWRFETVGYTTSTDTVWGYASAAHGTVASLLVQLPLATPDPQSVLYSTGS